MTSQYYEKVTTTRDINYVALSQIFPMVLEFIKSRKLVLTGGIAIDYALRLRGASIYSNDIFPDYDFLSPDNYGDAVALAETLCKAKFNVKIAPAVHLTTIRVRYNDYVLADITYCKKEIFDSLITLDFKGTKFVHPWYQFIDIHNSLSFPFDNVTREVIFQRWKKDTERADKLAKYYSVTLGGDDVKNIKVGCITCGAADATAQSQFDLFLADNADIILADGIRAAQFYFGKNESFVSRDRFYTYEPKKVLQWFANKKIECKMFTDIIGKLKPRIECVLDNRNVIIYLSDGKLIPAWRGSASVAIVPLQLYFCTLIAETLFLHQTGSDGRNAHIHEYETAYNLYTKMMLLADNSAKKLDKKYALVASSADIIFGKHNYSESDLFSRVKDISKQFGIKLGNAYDRPGVLTVTTDTGCVVEQKTFDYSTSKFFDNYGATADFNETYDYNLEPDAMKQLRADVAAITGVEKYFG